MTEVVPFCACEKPRYLFQLIERIWRPRRDLNPRLRRERQLTGWIYNKIQGTGRQRGPCKPLMDH